LRALRRVTDELGGGVFGIRRRKPPNGGGTFMQRLEVER